MHASVECEEKSLVNRYKHPGRWTSTNVQIMCLRIAINILRYDWLEQHERRTGKDEQQQQLDNHRSEKLYRSFDEYLCENDRICINIWILDIGVCR